MTNRGDQVTSRQIELAVARYFNHRQNLIVPNVSWGLPDLGHECDLLVVRPSGYAVEVEIKVSRGDIVKDQQKWHGHRSALLRQLWFAVPEKLLSCETLIPDRAGILIAYEKHQTTYARLHRPAKINSNAKALTQSQIAKVAHLGCMRIWTLKQKLEHYREWKSKKPSP